MHPLKTAIIIFMLFILFTGVMLFRKGVLTKERIPYLMKKISQAWVGKLPFFKNPPKKEKRIQSKDIVLALQEIEREKEKVAKEKERLEQLQKRLLVQEDELKERSKKILALKEEAQGYIKQKQAKQEEQITWLASVYENMRAEEAAPIIEKLKEDLALAILSQMDERQAGKILGVMDPKEAIKLSQKIGIEATEKQEKGGK